jgi:2',3'-cyclic-nucleotide 2'-phosphodiesterase (5'-nucleotidase family)
MQIHLFHTNDFHNKLSSGGVERLRNAVSAISSEPYLLLDAGDAIKAGNLGLSPSGEPILATMSDLGYQAMTMGNRETHPLLVAVKGKIGMARFPILSANQVPRKEVLLHTQSFTLLNINGIKVGVFGVTIPMVTERSKDKIFWDTLFKNPIEAAKRTVATLRPQCDLLVALTHIGFTRDKELLENVSGIDILVGGHSHTRLDEPVYVGDTPIVQTGCFAKAYGHGVLEKGENGWQLTNYALHPLN